MIHHCKANVHCANSVTPTCILCLSLYYIVLKSYRGTTRGGGGTHSFLTKTNGMILKNTDN